jgi:hypothetical protein
VQIINGDISGINQFYLGTLSGTNKKLIIESNTLGFSYVSTVVADNITYTLDWFDDTQKEKYKDFVSIDSETGGILIDIPTALPEDNFEKVQLVVSKITNYSTEASNVFFYITDADEITESITADLDSNSHIDVSVGTATLANFPFQPTVKP